MTHNTQDMKPILVLGGTGKTGRRVVERLTARGMPTRIGSRSADPPFDWEDQATWAPALAGRTVPRTSPSTRTSRSRARRRRCAPSPSWRLEHGVRRLVLLSGRGEEEAQRGRAGGAGHGRRPDDRALRLVHAELQRGLPRSSRSSTARSSCPAADQLEPFIDADDIADVAVAALTDDRHIGELYELTSPRLMTFADAVGEIAKATGRDIRYVPVSARGVRGRRRGARRAARVRRVPDLPVQRRPRPQRRT